MAYLFVLILLQITRGYQAFRVDISGDWLNELRVRVHVLHLEEGQNVLDLQVVRAVRHGLAFGGQATRSHPVGVLFLLEEKAKGLRLKTSQPDETRSQTVHQDVVLTVSHRSQISFIPSATGISSLMLNF